MTDSDYYVHTGTGSMNVNSGGGTQTNYAITGGTNNRQYNADFMWFHGPTINNNVPPEPTSTPTHFMPFAQDPDFVPRKESEELKQKLSVAGSRVALTGLGGVGKSQLAIQYGYELRSTSPETWIFWIFADSAQRFDQELRSIAHDARIPGRKDASGRELFQLVHNWLRDERRKWLVVLDGADETKFLFETPDVNEGLRRSRISYLPVCTNGSILITTRSNTSALRIVSEENLIALEPTSEHAVAVLQKRLGKSDEEHASATELALVLDYMPLAMTQAAAYIKRRSPRCSLSQYLSMCTKSDKSKVKLLNAESTDLRRDMSGSNSVMLTWHISFNHILEKRQSAADLLSLMSLCDRRAIPEKILRSRKPQRTRKKARLDSGSSTSESDSSDLVQQDLSSRGSSSSLSDDFEADVEMLRDYSFISLNEDEATFTIHSLVQLATQIWLKNKDLFEERNKAFIENLSALFPDASYVNWTTCRELFPHAESSLKHRPKAIEVLKPWATVLEKAGVFILQQGQAKEAEALYTAVRDARIEIYGKIHRMTLMSAGYLAETLWEQGRWTDAEKLELELISAWTSSVWKGSPETLHGINRLLSAWEDQGRWKEAESLLRDLVEQDQLNLGADHSSTLQHKSSLSTMLWTHGDREGSKQLRKEILDSVKKVSGDEHPETLNCMLKLAECYREQKQWKVVQGQEEEILEIHQRIIGEYHPSTLRCMFNLAQTLKNQAKWSETESLEVVVVQQTERVLGPTHTFTLDAMVALAATYGHQARWLEAEKLLTKVVDVRRKVIGDNSNITLENKAALAETFWKRGQWEQAQVLEEEVLKTRKVVLGLEHRDTLESAVRLVSAYKQQGLVEKANDIQTDLRRSALPSVPETRLIGSSSTSFARTRDHITTRELPINPAADR